MIQHHVEHFITSFCCIVEIVVRVVLVWQVDDTGKQCTFRKVEFCAALAKVISRCHFRTTDVLTEVQSVDIEFEDFFLVELLFQLHGQDDLLYFIADTMSGRIGSTVITGIDREITVLD